MPKLSGILAFAFAVTIVWTSCRLVLLKQTGIPQPTIHDEFSYLLGADTFSRGRVANPPHPLAKFYESPHEIARPAYASKYPSGQALFLALGQCLFGSPFYGVILSNGLMIFLFCVLFGVWTPLPWAVACSVAFAANMMPPRYWTDSYWGGSVAAIGGSLVLIAVRFLSFNEAAISGVVASLGFSILFITRPFEGGVFIVAVGIVFGNELWERRRWLILITAFPITALTIGFTAYTNHAITGKYAQLPYIFHDSQYNVTPPFWFLSIRAEPGYSHERLAAHHGIAGAERINYDKHQPWPTGLGFGLNASLYAWLESFGTPNVSFRLLLIILVAAPLAWAHPIYRRMGIISALCIGAMGFETWHFPHYSAPMWAAAWIMAAIMLQRLWSFRLFCLPIGAIVAALFLVYPPVTNFRVWQHLSKKPLNFSSPSLATKERLVSQLTQLQKPQLVFVHYSSPSWKVGEEWVYNGADIDSQKVIFAHDLGASENAMLIAYYPQRQVQILSVSESILKLEPYFGPTDKVFLLRPVYQTGQ